MTTLALGPLLEVTGDVDCTGRNQVAIDDLNPAIVWIRGQRSVNRVDTATGAVVSFPVGPLDYERQPLVDIEVLGGNVYVGADVYTDSATGQLMTAPDGSALSPQVFRIDATTGSSIVGPVGSGYLSIVDGQLVVRMNTGRAQVIDPATLVPTDINPSEVVPRPADERQITWFDEYDGDSWLLRAHQVDPSTGDTITEGSVDTTFGLNEVVFTSAQVGDDLLIFGLRSVIDPATGTRVSTTSVYRTTAQPPR